MLPLHFQANEFSRCPQVVSMRNRVPRGLLLELFLVVLFFLSSLLFSEDRGLNVVARQVTGVADFDAGRQFALVIGIDKYKEWPGLRHAVSEAKDVRRILSQRFYIDEFIEIYDTDATASRIRQVFSEELPRKIGSKDSLLVFYAGHGYLDSSNTGFWIACDGSKDKFSQNGWIPNAQLRNMIGQLKAERVLVLADACFSGDLLTVNRGSVPTVDSAFYRKALQLTARQVLTSGALETVPDESEFGRQLLSVLERSTGPLLDAYSLYERIRLGITQTLPLFGTSPGHEQGASFALFMKQPVPETKGPVVDVSRASDKGMVRITAASTQVGQILATIRPAGTNPDHAQAITGDAAVPEGSWTIEVRLKDDLEPTFEKTIAVTAGDAQEVVLPTLDHSRTWQRSNLQLQLDSLNRDLRGARQSEGKQKIWGYVGLGLCVAAAGVAAYGYFDGVAAYNSYSGAASQGDALAARSRMTLDSALLVGGASLAGVSVAGSSFLLFVSPTVGIQRRIDAVTVQIRLLGQ